MSLFIQEKEKLTDLVSEKGTRLIETIEIDTLYFIKSHLYHKTSQYQLKTNANQAFS